MTKSAPESPLARLSSDIDDSVTVIGVGPSGLASAIVLACAGRKVAVFECEKSVGARFRSDFQGLENWSAQIDVLEELRELDVAVDFVCRPVRNGVAMDSKGRSYTIADSEPLFYLVRRSSREGTLDNSLLRTAREAGVEIRFGEAVEHASARSIIASRSRRADSIASGYNFQTTMNDGAWVCFDDRLAPLGYVYLLVTSGLGALAVCLFDKSVSRREHKE